jgi:hypothetical protein
MWLAAHRLSSKLRRWQTFSNSSERISAMTQDRNTTIAEALDRLFRTYQQADRNADPGDLARERMAKAKVYFEAVSIYEVADIEQAITDFITGNVPGHNAAFAPSAPQVGSAVRRAMERRVERERLDRLALPPPPDDFVQDPPEVRAKNRALMDQLAASLASQMDMDRAPLRDLQRRTNERFDPPAYSVGDPDAEGDMGNRGAA